MKLNELEEKILQTIAMTGVARMRELKEMESVRNFSYTELLAAVKHLEETSLVTREIVRLGGSGGRNFYVIELSDKGKGLAKSLTNQEPIISQKEVLVKKHHRLEIAYLFEDCVPFLNEKGIDLQKTTTGYSITIEGKTYPILLDLGGKMFSREEYVAHFDKMWEQSSTFYYLSTNYITSSFLILDEIEAWLNTRHLSKEQQKAFRFNTSFMERILQGEGEHWDTLGELWTNSIVRWAKMPSVFTTTQDEEKKE